MVNANLDMANKNGWTPIIHLSGTNSTNIVGCLLERGVSVNKSSYAGVTAPNNAADTGQLAMGKLLCKWEASLEAAYNGQTPLWSASVSGHLEVVKFLSDQGASTGATDGNGWTLLHAAARNGHFEVARFLLGKGVWINAPTITGATALCLAANEGHTDIAAFLVSEGASIIAATNDG
jgi:ankyrin repeat protein